MMCLCQVEVFTCRMKHFSFSHRLFPIYFFFLINKEIWLITNLLRANIITTIRTLARRNCWSLLYLSSGLGFNTNFTYVCWIFHFFFWNSKQVTLSNPCIPIGTSFEVTKINHADTNVLIPSVIILNLLITASELFRVGLLHYRNFIVSQSERKKSKQSDIDLDMWYECSKFE